MNTLNDKEHDVAEENKKEHDGVEENKKESDCSDYLMWAGLVSSFLGVVLFIVTFVKWYKKPVPLA